MKRRKFIGIAAVGAAGLACPAARGVELVATVAKPRLLDVLHDERAVRELGRRYRELVPAEASADALAHAILPGSTATVPGALRARVDAQVRRDFAEGRTVTLNGWIVSVTEARQCALYTLLA